MTPRKYLVLFSIVEFLNKQLERFTNAKIVFRCQYCKGILPLDYPAYLRHMNACERIDQ